MIARLLIGLIKQRVGEIKKILEEFDLPPNHPDLLYFSYDSKLGIEQARKIKEHFSLKPYSAKGRGVVLEDASSLTVDAQNALLKTLEELPDKGIMILGADSDTKLLPTILSRCQVTRLSDSNFQHPDSSFQKDVEKLLTSSIEDKFEYIEKLKDRRQFLQSLVFYFHQNLASHSSSGNTNFLKELMQAEEWAKANVNIRAILEYLMLIMPKQQTRPIIFDTRNKKD